MEDRFHSLLIMVSGLSHTYDAEQPFAERLVISEDTSLRASKSAPSRESAVHNTLKSPVAWLLHGVHTMLSLTHSRSIQMELIGRNPGTKPSQVVALRVGGLSASVVA